MIVKTNKAAACLVSFVAVMLLLAAPTPGASEPSLNLIPWPQSVKLADGKLDLTSQSRIVFTDPKLEPLAKVLAGEVLLTTGLTPQVTSDKPAPGDIVLELSPQLKGEQYQLTVGTNAVVRGGNYRAAAWGTVTLVQALEIKDGKTSLPTMAIDDQPTHEYRGVLIDVGRKWHPVGNLKDVVVMCRLYKVNYIQLHLSDNELFTFPSKAFPTLATPNAHYSWEDLVDLVKFADERGVTLVPEIETPGHSGKLRQVAPFGRPGLGCIDMASEKTYEAFDTLFGEICEVFKSSPFIHIGTDESSLKGADSTPEEQAYMHAHNLTAKDLFPHHIVRLDQIIKKYGKRTMRWGGGFSENAKASVKLPKDIIHMMWEERGTGHVNKVDFTIINAAWKPLYVVGSKAWLPQYLLEKWNVRLWQHHMDNGAGWTVAPSVPVFGAQMCAWEQPPEAEIPSLRWRLPAMCERIYNPDSGKPYADFARRFQRTDVLLDTLGCPVLLDIEGLEGDPADRAFHDKVTVKLSAMPKGTIHYTLNGSEPTASSPTYAQPITVKVADVKVEDYCYSKAHGRYLRSSARLHVKVACFDPQGKPIGQMHDEILYAIPRLAIAKIYISPKMFDNTKSDWKEGKDWEKMGVKPDKELYWPNLVFSMPSAIRGAVFVPLCSGVISKGKINIREEAKYAFLYAEAGGEVYIDGKLVTKSNTGLLEVTPLSAGIHNIEVRYAHPHAFHYGTQTLSYAIVKDGQNINDLLDKPKGKETWSRPKAGSWKDHAELLVPLDGSAPPSPAPTGAGATATKGKTPAPKVTNQN